MDAYGDPYTDLYSGEEVGEPAPAFEFGAFQDDAFQVLLAVSAEIASELPALGTSATATAAVITLTANSRLAALKVAVAVEGSTFGPILSVLGDLSTAAEGELAGATAIASVLPMLRTAATASVVPHASDTAEIHSVLGALVSSAAASTAGGAIIVSTLPALRQSVQGTEDLVGAIHSVLPALETAARIKGVAWPEWSTTSGPEWPVTTDDEWLVRT